MSSRLRQAFRNSTLFHWYKKLSARGEYAWWKLRGSPGVKAPHLTKQRAIERYSREYGLRVLVETGTNYGHMIYVNKDKFREVYSIELDPWRAESARRKFAARSNIHVLEGDSGSVLSHVIPALKEPCLFWLDGHDFDISSPIKRELDAIYRQSPYDHVLLIDDARWFDGRTDYPTMEALREQVVREYPGRVVEVTDDIIRIYKPRTKPA